MMIPEVTTLQRLINISLLRRVLNVVGVMMMKIYNPNHKHNYCLERNSSNYGRRNVATRIIIVEETALVVVVVVVVVHEAIIRIARVGTEHRVIIAKAMPPTHRFRVAMVVVKVVNNNILGATTITITLVLIVLCHNRLPRYSDRNIISSLYHCHNIQRMHHHVPL